MKQRVALAVRRHHITKNHQHDNRKERSLWVS